MTTRNTTNPFKTGSVPFKKSPAEILAGLLNKFESSKVVLGPSGLKNNNAAERTDRKGVGFFLAGNGSGAAVGMLEAAVAPGRPNMAESVRFECADDVAGGDPSRDVQTVTSTAGDSVDAISESGGISLPSPASSSTIM